MKLYENSLRSLTKTITYRVLIVISNGIVVYLFTHNVELTLGVAFFTGVLNTLLYYFHERIWNVIHWGKQVNKK